MITLNFNDDSQVAEKNSRHTTHQMHYNMSLSGRIEALHDINKLHAMLSDSTLLSHSFLEKRRAMTKMGEMNGRLPSKSKIIDRYIVLLLILKATVVGNKVASICIY